MKKVVLKKSEKNVSKKPVSESIQVERAVEHLRHLRDDVAQCHRAWITYNYQGTLGDLLEHLTAAMDECSGWDEELIVEHQDEVGEELRHELDQWMIEEEETFDYRLANLEEYVGEVQELIEALGSDFVVTELAKVTDQQITTAAKKLAA